MMDRPSTRTDPRGHILAALMSIIITASVVACDNHTAPTAGPQQPTPTAVLRVTIDSLGSEVAVASLSEIRFEATSEHGADVRDTRIDFGDGASASQSSARHVYAAAGQYTATATFTLRSGREVTAKQSVLVRTVEGLWYHAGYNTASRHFEVRRITLSQEGLTVRGTLSLSGEPERPIAGTLSGKRDARLVADGQEFQGVIASSVTGATASWPLRLQGGTASGQRLTFQPAFGDAGAPPVANLQLIQPEGYIVEGLDIGFDASGSSGQDLSYFVEFGDGQYTSEPVSRHAPETSGHLAARLTVVDRFGRDAVATPRLDVEDLEFDDRSPTRPYPICLFWVHGFTNPANGKDERRTLWIESHEGRRVTGSYGHPDYPQTSTFSGSLSGSRGIRFVLDGGGIEFSGTVVKQDSADVRLSGSSLFRMPLFLRGGSADGQQLSFLEAIGSCS